MREDLSELFEPRGTNRSRRRADGWVGGRADTWAGHYQENAASRAGADARRMVDDRAYAAEVAESLRRADEDMACAAGLTIEPLSPGIGVVIRGVDLAKPTDAQVEQIRRLFLARKVVFFRDQGHITRHQHVAFARRFANVGFAYGRQRALGAAQAERERRESDHPEILRLYADEKRPFAASNWHSDVTWSNRPPLGSLLLARKAPPVGGDTVFADAYALWDSLHPTLREFLEGRTAVHGRGGRDEVEHPVCRTHPETGRKALYINPTFTNAVRGMDAADSARLLAGLYAKMYATPEHACRFSWRDGSVAMWDNRACQHYAVADFWPHERRMERVTLLDPDEANEVPFWEDADRERHYSVLLTSEEELATPIGRAYA